MKLNLNIGCGLDYKQSTATEKWINIDSDPNIKSDEYSSVEDLYPKYTDVDFILAQDVLEHVVYNENTKDKWANVLAQWVWCLKKGGRIQVQVPDPYMIFAKMQSGAMTEEEMNRVIYGENTTANDKHYQLISLGRLKDTMKEIGLKIVKEERLNVCAIIVGEKT